MKPLLNQEFGAGAKFHVQADGPDVDAHGFGHFLRHLYLEAVLHHGAADVLGRVAVFLQAQLGDMVGNGTLGHPFLRLPFPAPAHSPGAGAGDPSVGLGRANL